MCCQFFLEYAMCSHIFGYMYKKFDQETWSGTTYSNKSTNFHINMILIFIKRVIRSYQNINCLILCVKTIFLCVITGYTIFFTKTKVYEKIMISLKLLNILIILIKYIMNFLCHIYMIRLKRMNNVNWTIKPKIFWVSGFRFRTQIQIILWPKP